MKPTTTLVDLLAFVHDHQPCGQLVGDAEEPTPDGYRVWLCCPCGARLERWITVATAARDLLDGFHEPWRSGVSGAPDGPTAARSTIDPTRVPRGTPGASDGRAPDAP